MEEIEKVLRVLGDVFAPKADVYEPEIVAAYFADRPDRLSELCDRKHQVVLGRKGTGKTMVLKHLSLPSQIHRNNVPVTDDSFSVDFIGFYISLSKETQPTVGPECDPELRAVFGHWFNLVCLSAVLDTLKVLRESPKISLGTVNEFVKQHSRELLGRKFENVLSLFNWTTNQIKKIQTESDRPASQAVAALQAYAESAPRLTSPATFLPTLSSLLTQELEPIFRQGQAPLFFFLLDRFDEVTQERQDVLKHVIQYQQGQNYYVKLGAAHGTQLHLAGLTPPQDYRIVPIEPEPGTPNYRTFCTKVLEKRFRAIRERLATGNIDNAYQQLFTDPVAFLPTKPFTEQIKEQKLVGGAQQDLWSETITPDIEAFRLLLRNHQTPLYCGIDQFSALSCGCVRIFIELVHHVIRHALLYAPQLVLEAQHVPVDIQHKAVETETKNRHTQEFPTSLRTATPDSTVSKAAGRLFAYLMKRFCRSLDSGQPVLHCFELEETLTDADETLLFETLSVLERLGFLSIGTPEPSISVPGSVYSVSPVFAPHFVLPPVQHGRLALTHDDLRTALNPHQQRRPSEPELPLPERLKCFYATGFRYDWENAIRDFLRTTVFPKLDLIYVDGEDYHSESQQIGPSVTALLSSADFFIAEISDYNENVCHEVGIGIALGKCSYHIKNKQHRCPAPDARIGDLLSSLKYRAYECDPSSTKARDDISPDNAKTIEVAIQHSAEKFRKLPEDKRKNVNPFKSSAALHTIQKPDATTVFLFADHSAPMHVWIKEFSNKIREDFGAVVVSDPGLQYAGSEAQKYLECVARSTHCVIDVTDKNRFAWLLVGYAEGRERTPMAVWKRRTDGLITNYRGQAGQKEFDSKDDLWSAIGQFIAG